MSKEPELKPAGDGAAKKKGSKLLLIIGLVVVLAGGGAAAYWKLRPAPPAPAEGGAEAHAAPAKEAGKVAGGVVSLEPFLVNLAGGSGQTYLRTTLNLLVESEAEAKELQESAVAKARMRSAILEVLTQQAGDSLVTAEGKEALKKALLKQLQTLKQKAEVHDVLFSEFVVQF